MLQEGIRDVDVNYVGQDLSMAGCPGPQLVFIRFLQFYSVFQNSGCYRMWCLQTWYNVPSIVLFSSFVYTIIFYIFDNEAELGRWYCTVQIN